MYISGSSGELTLLIIICMLFAALRRALVELVLTALTLIFISAGSIQIVEERQKLSFHDAIYFVTISVTTVGYGDITAHTVLGRTLAIFFVLSALVAMPIQTSKAIEIISLSSGELI